MSIIPDHLPARPMTAPDPHALLAEAEALAEMATREPWTPAVEKARTLVPALCAALRQALAENQSMAQTLQFYADRDNYLSPSTGFAAQYDPAPSEVALDQGRRAQDALVARRSA